MSENYELSVASHFVRCSLSYQRLLALKVKDAVRQGIYVYDEVGYFNGAEEILIEGIRVLRRNNRYAVLSKAAQAVFRTSNTYTSYFTFDHSTDDVGVYI